MGLIRYAVLNDIHFPYEGKSYYRAIKIIEKWNNLKGIILNGDIAEIESVSSHPKHPTANRHLIKEIDYLNNKLDDIQKKFQGITCFFIEGNHCGRIFRFIRDIAPEMWGLIDCPKLLKFDERPCWKFFKYGPTQLVNVNGTSLWVRHEPLSFGVNCAKETALLSDVDILFGHTHTYQIFSHKRFGPKPRVIKAYSGGWLGDINQNIFDYRGPKDKWVNGFSEILIDEKTKEYEYNFIDLTKHNPFYEQLKTT